MHPRRRRSNFTSRILFFIILITVMRNMFLGDTWGGFNNMLPFVMVFVFFTFVSLASTKTRQTRRSDEKTKDSEDFDVHYEKKEEQKSEYDFDDEFAIDPRDYE